MTYYITDAQYRLLRHLDEVERPRQRINREPEYCAECGAYCHNWVISDRVYCSKVCAGLDKLQAPTWQGYGPHRRLPCSSQ